METLIEIKLSLTGLGNLLDYLEKAQDLGIKMTEEQYSVYLELQNKEAEKLTNGSN